MSIITERYCKSHKLLLIVPKNFGLKLFLMFWAVLPLVGDPMAKMYYVTHYEDNTFKVVYAAHSDITCPHSRARPGVGACR